MPLRIGLRRRHPAARGLPALSLSIAAARDFLLGQHGVEAVVHPDGHEGVRALLETARCIQLDPLDRIGTNADLVALARVDGIRKGDVYDALLPGHAFEHFAKERCLLPASAFPWYARQAVETPWWRNTDRIRRIRERDPEAVDAVLAEVRERGPLTPAEVSDRGRVEPTDWSGWKGTSKLTTLALQVLFTDCRVVVCGRQGKNKRYDVPERALPDHAGVEVEGDFARWALLERIEAAGLLSRKAGPWWSMLKSVRTSPLIDELVSDGVIEQVTVDGSKDRYLAPRGFRDRTFPTRRTRPRRGAGGGESVEGGRHPVERCRMDVLPGASRAGRQLITQPRITTGSRRTAPHRRPGAPR